MYERNIFPGVSFTIIISLCLLRRQDGVESDRHIRVSVPSQPVRVEDGLGEVIASGFKVSTFLLLTKFTKLSVTDS